MAPKPITKNLPPWLKQDMEDDMPAPKKKPAKGRPAAKKKPAKKGC